MSDEFFQNSFSELQIAISTLHFFEFLEISVCYFFIQLVFYFLCRSDDMEIFFLLFLVVLGFLFTFVLIMYNIRTYDTEQSEQKIFHLQYADEKGDVHHMRTSLNMQDGHSIDSFQQYINSLPEGTYKYVNGQWVKIK